MFEDSRQSAKIKEIQDNKQMENLLKDSIRVDEAGVAIKAYITYVNKEKVELRLDFKLPASSLSSFSLALNDLQIY